ncbi:hypothetical protein E3J84_01220, partial [Candidatus Aerophobetes bacterium]
NNWHRGGRIRDRRATVPCPWQIQFHDLRNYCGSAWYEKDFSIPDKFKGKRIVIVFEAVDYLSKLWVNGNYVGEHEGGHLPFKFDITALIRFEENNTVTLNVKDFQDLAEIPAGKQIWYSRISGIWQNVWIEAQGESFLADIFALPDIDNCSAEIKVEACSLLKEEKEYTLELEVISPNRERFIQKESVSLSSGTVTKKSFLFRFENPCLWDLDSPKLYEVLARLTDKKGRVVDSASTDFGMRKVEAKENYIYLNNRPLYIIGVTDQPDTPDKNVYRSEYSFPSDEDIKREIKLAKELGLNLLRKHVKCENPRYFHWADRLGILIWEEPPFFEKFTKESTQRFKETLKEMVIRDRNHPSLIIWGIFNESWGISEVNTSKAQQEFVEKMYDLAKELDPSRLILDNSSGYGHDCGAFLGMYPTYHHVKTDINDLHVYITAPDHYLQFKDWVAKIKARKKPVLLTEFGLQDPPNLDKIKKFHSGETPWWINSHSPLKRMEGYESRFYRWGLDKIYGDFTYFHQSHAWHNFEGLKCEIEEVRKNPDVSGYCITSFCDAFFEPFGLLDYFRDEKVFHEDLAKVQVPDLLITERSKLNLYSEEIFQASIYLSHLRETVLKDCTLRWSLAGFDISGKVEGIEIKKIGPAEIAQIEFKVPRVKTNKAVRVKLSLEKDGKVLAENYLDIYLFTESEKRLITEEEINVHAPEKGLLETLRQNGARVSEGLKAKIPFAVSTLLDEQLKDYLSKGGRVLLLQEDTLVDDEMGLTVAEPIFFPGNPFYYLKRSLFPGIPFDNPLGWPFYRVSPHRVLANLGRIEPADILSGCYGQFVKVDIQIDKEKILKDELAAAITKLNYGGGKVIISTFKLTEPYNSNDPVATIMLHNLIEYLVRGFDCQTSIPFNSSFRPSFVRK